MQRSFNLAFTNCFQIISDADSVGWLLVATAPVHLMSGIKFWFEHSVCAALGWRGGLNVNCRF